MFVIRLQYRRPQKTIPNWLNAEKKYFTLVNIDSRREGGEEKERGREKEEANIIGD